ncbi:MAG TPA: sigma 54-interacting transcriptional regulator [Longimicrobium sp.]|nr:sigma 54-interacting transcriptional regulator [Longimicrobium sp.]
MIARATKTVSMPGAAALSELAQRIRERSVESWGPARAVNLIGRDAALLEAQNRLLRFTTSDAPILLTGETGTGKELFARSVYLLGARRGKPFVRVNCAQYHDGNLMASELFGHKKGSFTGAVADHRGLFEEANGGVIFLDEIGELSLPAQAMLLRALGEGEIVPVGGTAVRYVDVRVIAATSRDLQPMVAAGAFREDLFYRLRHFWIRVPALRERGRDWELIAAHHLATVGDRAGVQKRLTGEAMGRLRDYPWPGNVRELKSLMDMGFHLCEGDEIGAADLAQALEPWSAGGVHAHAAGAAAPAHDAARAIYERMVREGESFWAAVREPFMERELSRADVRRIVEMGLAESHGCYKRLLRRIGVEQDDYLKFMDFLRHHRLKPEGYARGGE